jgi:hypothetical protein
VIVVGSGSFSTASTDGEGSVNRGRGQITDVQQPRYGQQVMDVLLPF